jgi:hypothetical protein
VELTHTHVWQLSTHLDGCHSWESFYTCLCGARRSAGSERDVTDEFNSWVWMLDEDCSRCQELLAGAAPKSWDEVLPGEG